MHAYLLFAQCSFDAFNLSINEASALAVNVFSLPINKRQDLSLAASETQVRANHQKLLSWHCPRQRL